MKHFPRRALPAALLAGLFLAGAARAADAEVKDGAKLFSAGAVQQANAVLKTIKSTHNKDVVVETFAAVPTNDAEQVKEKGADRDRYFVAWAESRMKVHGVKNIYVLICRSPPRFQIIVGSETVKKAFTDSDRTGLRDKLAEYFTKKEYDQGLAAAVSFIRERLDANEPVAALPNPVPNEVKDYANFFSTAAVSTANAELRDLHRQLNKNVTIETFATLPPDYARRAESRDEVFKSWVAERMKKSGVDGIHVLLCRSPSPSQPARSHLEIGSGPETSRAFTEADRKELSGKLVARFKSREFDQGLQDAIKFIRTQLQSRQPFTLPRVAVRQVTDRVKFFSPSAVAQADAQVKGIYRDYRIGVTIETIETIAPDRVAQVEKMTANDRNQYFKNLLDARVKQAGPGDDVHVLICRHPTHLQIDLRPEVQKKAFTQTDFNDLRNELLSRLTEKKYDDGLLNSVRLIRERLANHVLPVAVANQVKDHAHFFSAAAVQSANERLGQLRQAAQKNVTIESLPTVEPDQVKKVEDMSADERNQYFRSLLENRMKASPVDGVYVMIVKTPQHRIEIGAGPQTKTTFTESDRSKLLAVLQKNFGESKYDEGLSEAVDLLAGTPAKTATAALPPVPAPAQGTHPAPLGSLSPPGDAAPPKATSFTERASDTAKRVGEGLNEERTFKPIWILWGVLGFLGLWIFFGVLRALFGAGRRPSYNPPQSQTTAPASGATGGAAPQRPTGGYQHGGDYQGGSYQASGGYRGPAGGYQGGGYAPPAGGGGGGFMSGLLGGMFGAAAGNWIYDSFARRSGPGVTVTPPTQAAAPRPYGGQPQAPADSGIASTGGDFGDDRVSSTGADFGDDADSRVRSTGADFGDEPDSQAGSSGGDFGGDETADTGGGDFGGDSAGGDFGQAADAGGGGDFGGGDAATEDFSDSSGGDFGGGDTGGGNTGGDSGGDF